MTNAARVSERFQGIQSSALVTPGIVERVGVDGHAASVPIVEVGVYLETRWKELRSESNFSSLIQRTAHLLLTISLLVILTKEGSE